MAKPSVLFMNRTYPPQRSTSGRLLHNLAQAFEKDGWRVTIITTDRTSVRDREGTIDLIRLRAPKNPSNMFASSWLWLKMLFMALKQPKQNLLVTMADPPMLVVAGNIVRRIKKTPHIHWCQELYPDLFAAQQLRVPAFLLNFLKFLTRRAMNTCEKVIVPGRCMAKHLLRTGLDRDKISHIPNWADPLLAGHPGRNNGNSAANDHYNHGVNPALPFDGTPKFRVMHTGHIKRFHALATILRAAEILDTGCPDIEFVFVGSGAPFDLLAEERARMAVRNIRLMPFQPAEQAELVMKMGDVHLVSLNDDATGLVVPRRLYTAFEVERPCIFIGSPASESAQIIREYNAGDIIAPGDAAGLANLIRHYRFSGDAWFAAQGGALAAGKALAGDEFMRAWIKRAGQHRRV